MGINPNLLTDAILSKMEGKARKLLGKPGRTRAEIIDKQCRTAEKVIHGGNTAVYVIEERVQGAAIRLAIELATQFFQLRGYLIWAALFALAFTMPTHPCLV